MNINSKHYVCLNSSCQPVNFLFMGNDNERRIDRVISILERSGKRELDLRKLKDIDSQNWNNWKKRDMPSKEASSIAKALSDLTGTIITTDWLLTGNDYIEGEIITHELPKPESNAQWLGPFDTWDSDTPLSDDEVALPFFREVKLAAGSGVSEVIENHGCKLRFSKSTLRNNSVDAANAACANVAGNSMEPVLPDGTTVGIDTSQNEIISGEMYAIDHLGELRVKLLYNMPGGLIRIRSYNMDEWPDELVTPDTVRVIGWVFWYSVLRKRKK